MKYLITLLFAGLLIASCSTQKKEQEEVDLDSVHQDIMSVHSNNMDIKIGEEIDGQPVVKFSDVVMNVPQEWQQEVPSSDMRAMQFFIKEEPMAKIIGFYFGNLPDMVAENIERWEFEFTDLKTSDEYSILDGKIQMIVLKGTYKLKSNPMAMDYVETENYGTLAAILPSADGPYYFKMVAPASVIDSQITNFRAFLESYKVVS